VLHAGKGPPSQRPMFPFPLRDDPLNFK